LPDIVFQSMVSFQFRCISGFTLWYMCHDNIDKLWVADVITTCNQSGSTEFGLILSSDVVCKILHDIKQLCISKLTATFEIQAIYLHEKCYASHCQTHFRLTLRDAYSKLFAVQIETTKGICSVGWNSDNLAIWLLISGNQSYSESSMASIKLTILFS
jgi:hypothetical protein